ncbi:MAG: PDZ domain-containing protein [Planctomycetota bacterium]
MKNRLALPTLILVTGVAGLSLYAYGDSAAPQATPPQAAAEQTPADNIAGFLGVAVAESLAPQDAGPDVPRTVLLISDVMLDSPADAAGLRSGDVLLNIDGQVMLHPVQLTRLVAMHPAGQEVELTILRDGQPQTLTATLGERPDGLAPSPQFHPEANLRAVPGLWDFEQNDRPMNPRPLELAPLDLQGDLRDMQQRMDRQFEQMRQMFQQGMDEGWPGGDLWEHADPIQLDFNLDAMPGGQQVTVLQDQDHKLTVTQNTNGRHLQATDTQGNVLFDGPIDTPEQLQAVPEELRDKLPQPGEINLRGFPQLGPADLFERFELGPQPPADNDGPGEQRPAPAGRAV